MKKLLFVALSVLGSFSLVTGQTITVDITTGNSTLGTNDPIWDAKPPGASFYQPAYVASAVQGYDTDPCGEWIAHAVGPGPNYWPLSSASSGIYYYKRDFNLSLTDCENITAILDISFAAADNELISLKVNGNAVTIPTSPYIDFNPGQSIYQDISSFIQNGSNTVEVQVDNWQSYTALQICGEIRVTEDCDCYTTAPDGLNCNFNYLDWNDSYGALAYQVAVHYGHPACCEGDGSTAYSQLIDVFSGNSDYTLNPDEPCYAWQVRALCYDQPWDPSSWGPWSGIVCSCSGWFGKTEEEISGQADQKMASLFPNPANASVTLQGMNGKSIVMLLDLQGKIVMNTVVNEGMPIDISQLKPGVYFVEAVDSDGRNLSEKLVVE